MAKVKIILTVETENIASFLENWNETVQKLIEHAGVDEATLKIDRAKPFPLARY